MAYISTNYINNPQAPVGKWTCAPTSGLAPYNEVPPKDKTSGPAFCGQCVSFVKAVCPSLPATSAWRKGALVKDNKTILAGTVIATFDSSGKYLGHAAIFVAQSAAGIQVYDQWVTPPNPKPVGPRLLRWGAPGNANNADNYYIVD